MKQITKALSLSDQVANAVRVEIVQGRFKLGEMLSETRIANNLGVSRTPVREAFSRLEQEGLLITKPQSGTYVFQPSFAELQDIWGVRSCLELEAMRLACELDRGALASELGALVDTMETALKSDDVRSFRTLDRQFHDAVLAHSGNQLLQATYRPIANRILTVASAFSPQRAEIEKAHRDHAQIVEGLISDRFGNAADTMRAHIRQALRDAFSATKIRA